MKNTIEHAKRFLRNIGDKPVNESINRSSAKRSTFERALLEQNHPTLYQFSETLLKTLDNLEDLEEMLNKIPEEKFQSAPLAYGRHINELLDRVQRLSRQKNTIRRKFK